MIRTQDSLADIVDFRLGGARVGGGILAALAGSAVVALVTLSANDETARIALFRFGLALPLAASIAGQLMIVLGVLLIMDGLRRTLPHRPAGRARYAVLTLAFTSGCSLMSTLMTALLLAH